MKDKLFVDDSSNVYRITWWLAEYDDVGGTLGLGDDPSQYAKALASAVDRDRRQHIIACMTAAKTEYVEHTRFGFRWPSKRAATIALRQINQAIKNDGGPPWPDWALKAKAEGWKPPKSWKP